MGLGITTTSGAAPLEEWALRIHNFGDRRMTAVMSRLLSGEVVRSTDGAVEISAMTGEADSHRISIRLPTAPYIADLSVEALGVVVRGAPADPRSSRPSPVQWMNPIAGGTDVDWELFNCLVVSLESRVNLP